MLLRIIIICLIALWLYRFVRRLLPPPPRRRAAPRTSPAARGEMTRCGSCGMFITRSSAIIAGQTPYCSTECARSEAKQHS
ncbi:MAG: PP0621 family protein [Acidobacteriota bacterium]